MSRDLQEDARGRTCEVVFSRLSDDSLEPVWDVELSCGHEFEVAYIEELRYCPACGAKVVRGDG